MNRKLVPPAVGVALALGVGLVWWFAWGCTRCAAGWDMWRFLAIFSAVGGAAGYLLTRDHPQHDEA